LGVGLLLPKVNKFCDDMQVDPQLAGIVLSRVGRPAIHREQTVAALRAQFGNAVLQPILHERVAISEAVAAHKSIFDYEPNGLAAIEFKQASLELMTRLSLKGKK
jgi:chromosome partitioning protein